MQRFSLPPPVKHLWLGVLLGDRFGLQPFYLLALEDKGYACRRCFLSPGHKPSDLHAVCKFDSKLLKRKAESRYGK